MANKRVVGLDDTDEYKKRIESAKAARVPVGGAPMPQIPRLDQAPADRGRGLQNPNPAAILTPEQVNERVQTGSFIPGVGAAYAANQPAPKAASTMPPAPPPQQAQAVTPDGTTFVNPPRPEGGLTKGTLEQLAAVAEANKGGEEATESTKLTEKEISDLDDLEEEFDTDEFGNRVRNLLSNKKRKEAIEARCSPIKFDDLLVHQELRQKVIMIPGKFEPTYRTTTGAEDLWVKKEMVGDHNNTQYVLSRFAIMNLCLGLHSINGQQLQSHLDKDGDVDRAAFDKKLKYVLKFPVPILADLAVNYRWFDQRVRKLLVVDEIKGF